MICVHPAHARMEDGVPKKLHTINVLVKLAIMVKTVNMVMYLEYFYVVPMLLISVHLEVQRDRVVHARI